MAEWLTREEVDRYLDNRKGKGFNITQVCLFWGKREDDPVKFTTNPENAYGFKAFEETDGRVDASRPRVMEGGFPQTLTTTGTMWIISCRRQLPGCDIDLIEIIFSEVKKM